VSKVLQENGQHTDLQKNQGHKNRSPRQDKRNHEDGIHMKNRLARLAAIATKTRAGSFIFTALALIGLIIALPFMEKPKW